MKSVPEQVWRTGDYRSVLLKIFNSRVDEDAAYSLRRFARELEISPSALSEVFSRKRGISRVRAEKIARKLGLSRDEATFFVDLVEADHARSSSRAQTVRARVRTRVNRAQFSALEIDKFRIIEDWYHFAIAELTGCRSFVNDPTWFARRLGLKTKEVIDAIDRMKRVGLLEEKDGLLKTIDDFFLVADPSAATQSVRKAHRQILHKAIDSIDEQAPTSRELISSVISIHPDQIPAAKEALRKFSDQFVTRFGASYPEGKTDVYSVSLQFFSLLQPEQEPS